MTAEAGLPQPGKKEREKRLLLEARKELKTQDVVIWEFGLLGTRQLGMVNCL